MKSSGKYPTKSAPAKGGGGGLRGRPVMPAAKYRAPMKGMKNVSC